MTGLPTAAADPPADRTLDRATRLFRFEQRGSDSSFVRTVWRTRSGPEPAGAFTSVAVSHWELVVTRRRGTTSLTVRGPETRMEAYVDALTDPVDCIVLGRKLAEGFIPHWASGPEDEDQASIDKMNGTPKVVISNSLTESPWENAVVAGGDLSETVNRLKAQPGGDLIAYGGGTLVRALIAGGLLDELHLFVNPTALGAGMPVFADLGAPQRLRLVAAHPFECGITALHLEAARA